VSSGSSGSSGDVGGAVPLDELDQPVRKLVAVLNTFKGVTTTASCGGHAHPRRGQSPAGEWIIVFDVAPTRAGFRSLEYITWLVNDALRHEGGGARVALNAFDPLLNHPRTTLYFYLEGRTDRKGRGKSADDVAEWLVPTAAPSAATPWEQLRIAGAAPLRESAPATTPTTT